MTIKQVDLMYMLKRISKIASRLKEIASISKIKLPSIKDQIAQINSEIDVWSQKLSSIDVEFELAKMLDWLKATNKRKKYYRAFFRNWLRKSTNTVGNDPVVPQSYTYSCAINKASCKDEISSFKDMSFYCDECNKINAITNVTRS